MQQKIPTAVAVVIIVVVLLVAIFIVWRKAGEKPVVGYEEFRKQMQGQPMGGPPGGLQPAPRPPEKRPAQPGGSTP
jgi:hypothetical protein